MRAVLLAACLCVGGLVSQPAPMRAQGREQTSPSLRHAASQGAPATLSSPAWWREGKKRFQQLALCALASANVTFTLLVGFSGVGAAIGFAAALLGVVMCL